jgi:hypothetical protein
MPSSADNDNVDNGDSNTCITEQDVITVVGINILFYCSSEKTMHQKCDGSSLWRKVDGIILYSLICREMTYSVEFM